MTGEEVADPKVLLRRPIAIKISNSPAEWVRPQSGLSQADLVFEHLTEGPVTRFTAVFYSQTPPEVGPIRSARLIDLEIPAMYDAGLVFSGASDGVNKRLYGSDLFPRLIFTYEPGYYRTGADKPYEHTLYGTPSEFWWALERKQQNLPPNFVTTMSFHSDSPQGGTPAGAININYRDWTVVDWVYDPETGRYWRWADGEPHLDANNDEQLSAANVVIVYALHVLDESICENLQDEKCLAGSVQAQIWEEGEVVVFRDGLQYTGFWRRAQRSHMLTFYDLDGDPLPLQIGNTWFQMMPYNLNNPIEITP